MTYSVKEIFYTLQGEGAQAGRAAVFCRFAGCNLWSGREVDRSSAICQFCDTDFVGVDGESGGKYRTADGLATVVDELWNASTDVTGHKYVVLTGGEPALQADEPLVDALHQRGFEVAIETNGTISLPQNIDWVCVSPKQGADIVVTEGHELKVVVPQPGLSLEQFERFDFSHYFVQACDGSDVASNMQLALSVCRQNPKWRLSMQTHKLLGIP